MKKLAIAILVIAALGWVEERTWGIRVYRKLADMDFSRQLSKWPEKEVYAMLYCHEQVSPQRLARTVTDFGVTLRSFGYHTTNRVGGHFERRQDETMDQSIERFHRETAQARGLRGTGTIEISGFEVVGRLIDIKEMMARVGHVEVIEIGDPALTEQHLATEVAR